MTGAGMRLCKLNTNDDDWQRFFTSNGANKGAAAICDNTKEVKILRLLWNRKDDRLAINMKNVFELIDERKVTKRSLLQTSARIYDPLGVIAPVVVTVTLLFQRLWELALEWDGCLPDGIGDEWSDWCSQLSALQEKPNPQKYAHLNQRSDDTTVQLHVFGDASAKAYGAVAYLKTGSKRNVTIALLMSKSRVALLKKLTLPRLELMGALIAARLHRKLINTLNLSIQAAYLWTDTNIAMHWIKGSAIR
ncbi:uncharacterized protein LOC120841761 [Ixodes scapularis]|uniref:uncharacterized protein LOC120841761 n=1 Tax=Ixodes scapularis TaxID=6945 RepID=UPI001A9D0745|nr:uncharacterized protein LOC120841761 [Ixodes scapularis]